jgi:hypothetical protein
MKGYFISISKDKKRVYIYNFSYDIYDKEKHYNLHGSRERPTIRVAKQHVSIAQNPGYRLRVSLIENTFFEHFLKAKEFYQTDIPIGSNQTDMPIVSVINRYSADRQFILIARNGVSQRPINVTMIGLAYSLSGRANAEPILFWNKYKNDHRNMYNENSDEEYLDYEECDNKEDDFENDNNNVRPKKKSTLNDNNLRDEEEEDTYTEVQQEDKKSSVRNNTKNQNAGQQKQRVDN